ncbi:MAG: peptidoglycan DD-metalloendopeptidase family protein [Pseudomonadota bacterium]
MTRPGPYRRPRRQARLAAACLALGVLAAPAALAPSAPSADSQTPNAAPGTTPVAAPVAVPGASLIDRIREAEAALAAAEGALEAAGDGESRLAALGTAVRAQEMALAAYRAAHRGIAHRADAVLDGIDAGGGQLTALLGALQARSTAPESALFAFPGGPVQAARAQMLLAAIAPALEARRALLAAELDRLRQLRVDQDIARAGATAALGQLQALRAETAIALQERQTNLPPRRLMRHQAAEAGATARDIGALGETLADLLDLERAAAPAGATLPAPGFQAARGVLLAPVAGRLSGRFGDPDPWGAPGAGITLAAPAYAEVAAPTAGTVRYAGALQGYGEVVILEPADSWLITLAGLAGVDRAIGEIVRRGERLGELGGLAALPEPSADDAGADNQGANGVTPAPGSATLSSGRENLLAPAEQDDLIAVRYLYVEVRREGVPVDPAPWFAGLE